MPRRPDTPAQWLAALMGTVGSLHFVFPGPMAKQVPAALPAKRALVYASGAVEVSCAAGLAARRPWAGKLAALTLLAIWPANVQMALDAGSGRNPGPADNPVLMWLRVPLQLPMIWVALRAGRQPAGAATGSAVGSG